MITAKARELSPELNTGAVFGKIILEDGKVRLGHIPLGGNRSGHIGQFTGSFLFSEVTPGTTLWKPSLNYVSQGWEKKR